MEPETITLVFTKEQYDTLLSELYSLYGYHWNDDRIKACDCGSKTLEIINSLIVK